MLLILQSIHKDGELPPQLFTFFGMMLLAIVVCGIIIELLFMLYNHYHKEDK